MTPLLQGVRYQRLQEAESDEQEEEITVHLYNHSSRTVIQAHRRDAALRICSSLFLLAIAIGFVLYELEYGSVESPSAQHSFHHSLSPPENISTLETNHHGSHRHSEETVVRGEHKGHQHGGDEQSGSLPASHSHSAGTYHRAAAVTDSESCSIVARDIMRTGGSVVDAGIAAVLCLSVVHSHCVSLGGIFTSIYFNGTTQNASVLNAVPSKASPIPYGTPTLLQGLWVLHQRHGRKLWSDLFNPAIDLAILGFLVDKSLHTALEQNQNKAKSSEGLQRLFYNQDILKRVGDSVTNVPLGNMLKIAKTMRDSALSEVLMQNLLSDIGLPDREKFHKALSNLHLKSEAPIRLQLDGLTLYSSSAPTAGRIFASSVQEVYQNRSKTLASISEVLVNVSKTMYRHFGVWPAENGSAGPQRQWDLAPVGSNVLVTDADGNMVVIALTLNSTFGSGFVSPSTGILLSDFVQESSSVTSNPLSFWACPSILLFGANDDIVGLTARGGSSLPFHLAHVLLSHVLQQMDLTESIIKTLTDLQPRDADPWLKYFDLQIGAPEAVMAVEMRAEHVHVVTSQDCLCYPTGL
ncbi:hypothetical protein PRIEUP_LOCUS604 [Pristimantis euphronides]